MNLQQQWSSLQEKFDARSRKERTLVALLVLGAVVWLFAEMVHAPARAEINRLQRQISNTETRLAGMENRALRAEADALSDPDRALRDRLQRLVAQQQQVQRDITALAGNLVSPYAMTRLLTTVLDEQSGLTLNRVENRTPQPMRTLTAAQSGQAGENSDRPFQQIYRHSLVLEFEGDFLSMLRYLLHLENLSESFFWDSIHFAQAEWPNGRITLELYTLSVEEGFIGV